MLLQPELSTSTFRGKKREKKKKVTAHCSTHILNIDEKTEKIELEM